MPVFFRDQHADDVKEDLEERTESEVKTPHEARGRHNLILLVGITSHTQQSKLNWVWQSPLH